MTSDMGYISQLHSIPLHLIAHTFGQAQASQPNNHLHSAVRLWQAGARDHSCCWLRCRGGGWGLLGLQGWLSCCQHRPGRMVRCSACSQCRPDAGVSGCGRLVCSSCGRCTPGRAGWLGGRCQLLPWVQAQPLSPLLLLHLGCTLLSHPALAQQRLPRRQGCESVLLCVRGLCIFCRLRQRLGSSLCLSLRLRL